MSSFWSNYDFFQKKNWKKKQKIAKSKSSKKKFFLYSINNGKRKLLTKKKRKGKRGVTTHFFQSDCSKYCVLSHVVNSKYYNLCSVSRISMFIPSKFQCLFDFSEIFKLFWFSFFLTEIWSNEVTNFKKNVFCPNLIQFEPKMT